MDGPEVLERAEGRCGELVLRRSAGDLEVIADGTFLISGANAASSEALVGAALPFLRERRGVREREADPGGPAELDVLIGGLGLGYALDVALAEPAVRHVTVVEYEPLIVDWFRRYGEGRAERLAAGEAAGRARVVVRDVADVLRAGPATFDLIALDTDNGPDWLLRAANAGLYDAAGVALAAAALRPGGAAVFWSPERYDWFAERLRPAFAAVHEVMAHDVVGGRRHAYIMYVGLRGRLRA